MPETFTDIYLIEALIVFGCLILSGFFSGSETAITSLGDAKVKHIAESELGFKKAALQFWIDRPGLVLSTILVGNNLVNILASALMTDLMLRVVGSAGVALATGFMTALILIFGEITPKSFAKAKAEKLIVPILVVIRLTYFLLFPFVRLFGWFGQKVIDIFGVDGKSVKISEQELQYYIRLSQESGFIPAQKEAMLRGLLSLKKTRVQEVMTPRPDVKMLDVHTSIQQVIDRIVETGHTRIPLYDEKHDNVVGLIHAIDLLKFDPSEEAKKAARAPMFVYENKELDDLLDEMRKTRNHMAIVNDEYGSMVGLVTMENVLEEIVGDIQDEYDREAKEVEKLSEKEWQIHGLMHWQDFENYFQVKLEPEQGDERDYNTMAGFVVSRLGSLPKVGDQVKVSKYRLQVMAVTKRRIEFLKVRRLS